MRRIGRRASSRRGVTPIIATVLLLALTMVLVATLYYIVRTPMPPQAPYLGFQAEWNVGSVELLGDGDNAPGASQCPAATGHICFVQGTQFVLSQVSSPAPPISQILVQFMCNGTVALQSTLAQITAASAIAGGGAGDGTPPTSAGLCGGHYILNHCQDPSGNWVSGGCPSTDLNCFGSVGSGVPLYSMVYYTPTSTTSLVVEPGDTFTAYSGGYCISASIDPSIGDDYYGPPSWCNTIPGACSVQLFYTGNPQTYIGGFSLAQPTTG